MERIGTILFASGSKIDIFYIFTERFPPEATCVPFPVTFVFSRSQSYSLLALFARSLAYRTHTHTTMFSDNYSQETTTPPHGSTRTQIRVDSSTIQTTFTLHGTPSLRTRRGRLVGHALGILVQPAFEPASGNHQLRVTDSEILNLVWDRDLERFLLVNPSSPLSDRMYIVASDIRMLHHSDDCFVSVRVMPVTRDCSATAYPGAIFMPMWPVAIPAHKVRNSGLALHARIAVGTQMITIHDGSNVVGTDFELPRRPLREAYPLADIRFLDDAVPVAPIGTDASETTPDTDDVAVDSDEEDEDQAVLSLFIRLSALINNEAFPEPPTHAHRVLNRLERRADIIRRLIENGFRRTDHIHQALIDSPYELFNDVDIFVLRGFNLTLMEYLPRLVGLVTNPAYPDFRTLGSAIFRLMQRDVTILLSLEQYFPQEATPAAQNLSRHIGFHFASYGVDVFRRPFLEFLTRHISTIDKLIVAVPASHRPELNQIGDMAVDAYFSHSLRDNVFAWMTDLDPAFVGHVATNIEGMMRDAGNDEYLYIQYIPYLGRFFARDGSSLMMTRLRTTLTQILRRNDYLDRFPQFVDELDGVGFFDTPRDVLLDTLLRAESPAEALFALPKLIEATHLLVATDDAIAAIIDPRLREPHTTDEYMAEMTSLLLDDHTPLTRVRRVSRSDSIFAGLPPVPVTRDDGDEDSDDDDFVPIDAFVGDYDYDPFDARDGVN